MEKDVKSEERLKIFRSNLEEQNRLHKQNHSLLLQLRFRMNKNP